MSNLLLFNTPLELGLRGLYLLQVSFPLKCSLDRLIFLDYLTIYTKDSDASFDSLHPEYPLRTIELFSRREAIKKGMLLMASKGLVNIDIEEEGFLYSANINTNWFIEALSEEYSKKLMNNASLVEKRFRNLTDSELEKFVNTNIKSWGKEYLNFFPYKNEVF
ncbi:hypothetical protein H1230_09520 [Paenibacillus sp. 19GGS1-52]|uniref:ABC-three component system middle component 2 n=1 Tax=Paenibacillus sp. 19GGS1-52 TaxID=2758563 RepID=UPI001EFA9143|nr:ABC-three component system middle component 2 [Paenibacillus sp. 19GGS1-52]ULO08980.1 hypothetical protein H1230_09520 [Paenibacillus sp. 19GGS1-52]